MAVTNLTALIFTMGFQGGTIHQVADSLMVSADIILNADEEKMGELLRKAQRYRSGKDQVRVEQHRDLLERLEWAVAKLDELGKSNEFTIGMVRSLSDCHDYIKSVKVAA